MDVDDPATADSVSPQLTKKSKKFSRTEIRSKSQVQCEVEHGVRRSLQECSLSENREKLERAISSYKDGSRKQRNLKAMLYILECLFANAPTMLSFMTFEDAFNIYKSFVEESEETISGDKQAKNEFRNLLCSRQNGLCIYLMRMRNYELVILRPDDVCLEHFLSFVVIKEHPAAEDEGDITKEYCQDLVSVMDTEWDRCVLRVFAACGRTNSEVSDLGFESDLRTADKEIVQSLIRSMKDMRWKQSRW